MSQLRFNHVFSILMLLAALAAFVLPQHISSPAQAQLQVLFTPISRPIYSLAGWVHNRSADRTPRDDGSPDHPRTADELVRENTDLRQQNLMLAGQLDKLKELDAERAKVGDLRDRCIVAAVSGRDSSLHDTLLLSGGSLQGLGDGMVVLSPDGLIGRLEKVGIGASQVRSIAEKGSKISVSFARFETNDQGGLVRKDISYPPAIAKGLGDGEFTVELETWDKIKDVFKIDDWAILDDADWPKGVTHYRVGKVTAVRQNTKAPGFGEIRIQSLVELSQLKEVMVLKR